MKYEREEFRHGTSSGYDSHHRRGEQPCDACWQAQSEYNKRYRSSPEVARRGRLRAKAQNKAKTELTWRHPEEYASLYAKAKKELGL